MQTISGSYPEESDNFHYPPHDGDLRLGTGSVDPVCRAMGNRSHCPGDLRHARPPGATPYPIRRAMCCAMWLRPMPNAVGNRWSRRRSNFTWSKPTRTPIFLCNHRSVALAARLLAATAIRLQVSTNSMNWWMMSMIIHLLRVWRSETLIHEEGGSPA